jgi:methionyl-tRNA formyltransferase
MRSILIGAVESSAVALEEMQRAGLPPTLLATLDPATGSRRHADYVDLAKMCGPETEIVYPENINDPVFLDHVRAVEPDTIFVIGWSQLVGAELRGLAGNYVIGFHPTPLPVLRGRAPIGWTILSGMSRSGTSLFLIDDGVDTGPILDQHLFELSPRETARSLIDRVSVSLREMLRRTLPRIADRTAKAAAQSDENASYGARRTSDDGLINWSLPAEAIDRLIRAQGRPYAGAFTFSRKSKVIIWEATPYGSEGVYFAAKGQICAYDKGRPIVLCGDDRFLRIDSYEVIGRGPGFRFAGQTRFYDAAMEGGA